MMVKFMAAEVSAMVPPPYGPPGVPGLVTVTGTVPLLVIAVAGIMTETLPALSHCVPVWAAPLKLMTALPLKFEPSTSRENAALPAAMDGGLSCVMAGIVPGVAGIVDLLE